MRKIALVFVLAVIVPSLVLAWLAVRSLRDQQFLIERQQSLLLQGVSDAKAQEVQSALAEIQREFTQLVTGMLTNSDLPEAARAFDDWLPPRWPLAEVAFVVMPSGEIVSPALASRAESRRFLEENGSFLANRESVEVYLNPKQLANNALVMEQQRLAPVASSTSSSLDFPVQAGSPEPQQAERNSIYANSKNTQTRNVIPQQQVQVPGFNNFATDPAQPFSRLSPAETEFRLLVGQESDGLLARFVDNRLNVLVWCRPPARGDLIFGAKLSLAKLRETLAPGFENPDPGLREEICLALLDDKGKPVARSHPEFQGQWKRPFVATEIGESLPHWEAAVYLLDPGKLTRAATTLKLTLGLVVLSLLVAIGVGTWLMGTDIARQLALARQKTDFVSNVSHELKTPLTSIRMFSELLAEGRVADPERQRSYLNIISAEAGRLTRLINNVLDFARMERGEKKYHVQSIDLRALAQETCAQYRPHLENAGFAFACEMPESPVPVRVDPDALAQVLVNLLSNAEKYSNGQKDIRLSLKTETSPLPHARLEVMDRGPGIPAGCEEKIFEKFYRAHESLSSGIQGSGLGLTLARQIARAHGGDVQYSARPGGGSCFSLRLPLSAPSTHNPTLTP